MLPRSTSRAPSVSAESGIVAKRFTNQVGVMKKLLKGLMRPLGDRVENVLRRDVEERRSMTEAASPEVLRRARAIVGDGANSTKQDHWLSSKGMSVQEANEHLGLQVGKAVARPQAAPSAPAPVSTPAHVPERPQYDVPERFDPASDDAMEAFEQAQAEAAALGGARDIYADDEDQDEEAQPADADASSDDDGIEAEGDDDLVSGEGAVLVENVDDEVNLYTGPDDEDDGALRASSEALNIGRALNTFVLRSARGELPAEALLRHLGKLMRPDLDALMEDPSLGEVEKRILGLLRGGDGIPSLRVELPYILGWKERPAAEAFFQEAEPEESPTFEASELLDDAESGSHSASESRGAEPNLVPGEAEVELFDQNDGPAPYPEVHDQTPGPRGWWSPVRMIDRRAEPSETILRDLHSDPDLTRGLLAMICDRRVVDFKAQHAKACKRAKGLLLIDLGSVDQSIRDQVVMSLHALDDEFFTGIDRDATLARGRFLSMAAFVLAFDRLGDWIDALAKAAEDDFGSVELDEDRRKAEESIEHLGILVEQFRLERVADFVANVKAAWKRRSRELADNDNATRGEGLGRGLALFNASKLEGDVKAAFSGFVEVARSFSLLEVVIGREMAKVRGKGQEDHKLFGALQQLRAEGATRAHRLRDLASAEGLSQHSLEEMLTAQGEGIRDAFVTLMDAREIVERERAADAGLRQEVARLVMERDDMRGRIDEALRSEAAAKIELANAERSDSLEPLMADFRHLMESGATKHVHGLEGGSVVREVKGGALQLAVSIRDRQVGFFFMHGGGADDWTLRDSRVLASDRLGLSVDLARIHAGALNSPSIERGVPLSIRVLICHGNVNAGGDIAMAIGAVPDRRAALLGATPADQVIETASFQI